MAYCSIDDVKARCQRLPMSAASTPTGTQVTEFIDQCAAAIDAMLYPLGYTIPVDTVSSPKSAEILKKANADGAAFYALNAAYSYVSPNASKQGSEFQQEWETFLKRLQKGELVLPDAAKSAKALGEPEGPGLASSFQVDEGNEPFIERDKEW